MSNLPDETRHSSHIAAGGRGGCARASHGHPARAELTVEDFMADVNAKEHEMGQKMWHRISTITVLPALAGLMLTALSLFMLTVLARNEAEAQQSQRGDSRRMNINIIVGDTAVRAVLDDNPTSRD